MLTTRPHYLEHAQLCEPGSSVYCLDGLSIFDGNQHNPSGGMTIATVRAMFGHVREAVRKFMTVLKNAERDNRLTFLDTAAKRFVTNYSDTIIYLYPDDRTTVAYGAHEHPKRSDCIVVCGGIYKGHLYTWIRKPCYVLADVLVYILARLFALDGTEEDIARRHNNHDIPGATDLSSIPSIKAAIGTLLSTTITKGSPTMHAVATYIRNYISRTSPSDIKLMTGLYLSILVRRGLEFINQGGQLGHALSVSSDYVRILDMRAPSTLSLIQDWHVTVMLLSPPSPFTRPNAPPSLPDTQYVLVTNLDDLTRWIGVCAIMDDDGKKINKDDDELTIVMRTLRRHIIRDKLVQVAKGVNVLDYA